MKPKLIECMICGKEKEEHSVQMLSKTALCFDCFATPNLFSEWIGRKSAVFNRRSNCFFLALNGALAITNISIYVNHGGGFWSWMSMTATMAITGGFFLACRSLAKKIKEHDDKMFIAMCAGPETSILSTLRWRKRKEEQASIKPGQFNAALLKSIARNFGIPKGLMIDPNTGKPIRQANKCVK